MRRSFILLAGAAVIAGGATLVGGDAGAPSASIQGAELAEAATVVTTAPAEEIATFEALADKPVAAAPEPPNPYNMMPAAPKNTPLGALVDLDKITRVGDHYEAPLKDGRLAILTLDPELQPLAEKLLNESRAPKGAIVVMTPDGRILALAGRRTEEPKGSREGIFDWRLATDVWAPAASIFKLVTASALVNAGVGADDKVCYHGGVRSVMESNLVDHKRDSRCESLSYGVAHSNNAILGKLAYQRLQPDLLDAAARKLGFAHAGGALPGGELPGTFGKIEIPTTKDLSFAKSAAGFFGAHLSAAGGALLTATFANGGEQPVPHLIQSIDGKVVPAPPARRLLPAETARAVASMMAQTCTSGSAAKTFRKSQQVKAAGKTGTITRTDPFYMEHSWFVGFAPVEKPEIIVSVVFGNPESWHLRGHEGARRLIDLALSASKRGKDRTASLR